MDSLMLLQWLGTIGLAIMVFYLTIRVEKLNNSFVDLIKFTLDVLKEADIIEIVDEDEEK